MTFQQDSDTAKNSGQSQPANGLLSGEHEILAGIRVTRAQFARMIGCSRQSVTEWVQAGRLTVGPDGRFDPCKAVADLLRTGDPAKLRVLALRPAVEELARSRNRIADLEVALQKSTSEAAALREDRDFCEASGREFLELFESLSTQLALFWPELAALPDNAGLDAINAWMQKAFEFGAGNAGLLLDDAAPDY